MVLTMKVELYQVKTYQGLAVSKALFLIILFLEMDSHALKPLFPAGVLWFCMFVSMNWINQCPSECHVPNASKNTNQCHYDSTFVSNFTKQINISCLQYHKVILLLSTLFVFESVHFLTVLHILPQNILSMDHVN